MTDPEGSGRPTMAPFLGALAIIVLVVIAIGLFNIFGGDDVPPDQQVGRAAVGQNDALQRQNYVDFRTYTCRDQQGVEADVLARQRDSVAKRGERFVDDVTDVVIDGDRATAKVTYHFDKAPDAKTGVAMMFVREDGAWKVCSTGPSQLWDTSDVSYAGDITPAEAWKLLNDDPEAVLVDCRTDAEWRFVGVPDLSSLQRDVVYVEWNSTDGKHNDNFVDDLVAAGVAPGVGPRGSRGRPVVFLCRSGNRSIPAAAAATEAGIAPSYNVLDGFEGNLDEQKHRGGTGWKAVGLPWKQS